MKPLDILITPLLLLIPLLHLIIAPYTKVEESFNLQATHDILVYGTPTADISARFRSAYDHFDFPGAVPRTFVGPVLLAGFGQPLVAALGFHHAQFVVRALLGLWNGAALLVFKRALGVAFGDSVARWWTLMMVTQFHIMYYATRLLPNMFAFGLTTFAAAYTLPHPDPQKVFVRRKRAVGMLVSSAAVFRSETAILLAATSLQLLISGQLSARSLVPVFLGSFVAALVVSVPLDSYFWQKPLWPELWGFYYNAVLGSSSDWGVSPWHYYFTSAVPRLLANPLSLPLIGFAAYNTGTRSQVGRVVIPSLAFIAVYSFQPHKETRFIFYAVPSLTAAAALGANYIFTRRSKSTTHTTFSLLLVLSLLGSFAISCGMLLLSSLNYPGGDALSQLYSFTSSSLSAAPEEALSSSKRPLLVHADVLTCMTGLTLMLQNPLGLPKHHPSLPYVFDKTEKDVRLGWPRFWQDFDYVLMEDTSLALGHWEMMGWVSGYDGVELLRPGQPSGGPAAAASFLEARQNQDVEKGGKYPSRGIRDGNGGMTICNDCGELGMGARVALVRDWIRRFTGGWWIGPKMSPRIYIMKQVNVHEETS